MFLLLSLLQPTIHVDFRKEIGAISAIQIEKHANHCVSEEIDSWLTNREGSLCSDKMASTPNALLSLSIYIHIYVCFENGIRAFEKATFAKNGEKKRKYLTQRMPCFRKFAELSRLIVDNWVFELIKRGDDSRVNEVRVIRVVSRTAFLKIVVVKFRVTRGCRIIFRILSIRNLNLN